MQHELALAILSRRRDQIAFEMIEAEGEEYLLLETELANLELEISSLENEQGDNQ